MLEVELLNEQTVEAIDEEIVDSVEEIVEQSVVETEDGLITGEEIILQQQEVILSFSSKTSRHNIWYLPDKGYHECWPFVKSSYWLNSYFLSVFGRAPQPSMKRKCETDTSI